MMVEDKIEQLADMLGMWDLLNIPYADIGMLNKMGTITDSDGDEIQITNSMMGSVAEVIRASRKQKAYENKRIKDLQWDLQLARDERDKAREYAAMSDARIGDELDKEIEWYKANEGREDCVYGPVELLSYCRDRLRSRT
jgi:hypothetical protein